MVYLKNVLEVVNETVVIPIAVITFFLLMYIALYLREKDPDIIRSRFFLNYNKFIKAYILLVLFAFVLIFHVTLIYIPHYFNTSFGLPITELQPFFGLVLVIIMLGFAYFIYRTIK